MDIDQSSSPWLAGSSADALNQGSFCRTLNQDRLDQQLERDPALKGLMQSMVRARPHLFSSTVVFLSAETAQQINDLVRACESVMALPGVAQVHDLHVWATGTSQIALTAHLVMPQGQADDALLKLANHRLHEQFDITHVTLQVMQEAFTRACAVPDQPSLHSHGH